MSNAMQITSIGIIAAILSGCAATGSRYSEVNSTQQVIAPSNSRLVLFRTKDSNQYAARSPTIKIDGKDSGSCDYGGFNTFVVASGKHVITVDMWDTPGKCELPVEVLGGNSYYFEVKPRIANLLSFLGGGMVGAAIESSGQQCGGAFSISLAEENAALPQLSNLRASK